MKHARLLLWGLLGLSSLAVACGSAPEATAPPIPRVKVFEVGDEAQGQLRSISGELAAAKTSPLSFGVAGTVDRVHVNQGATVKEGQILATLDREPLRLQLQRKRSDLSSSNAKAAEAKQEFDRAKTLADQGVGSRANVEVATATLKSARAILRGHQAAVEEAERDLGRAELRAPFAGGIAERSVDPFEEVGVNTAVFLLQSDEALVVKVQVPEVLVRHVDYAQPVRVTFPTQEGLDLAGVVSLIGAQAGSGNSFAVEVQLLESRDGLRPGMTAKVAFNFDAYLEGKTSYLIPLSAIAIDAALIQGGSPEREEVPVYLLNEEAGRVEQRMVRIGGLRGNQLEVFDGLQPGDKVISAGVAFLRDGMEAERWFADQGLSDG